MTVVAHAKRIATGMPDRRAVGLVLGLVLFAVFMITPPPEGLELKAWRVAAVATLMAIWWLTEALPLAATSLLPIALFPLIGVANIHTVTAPYANHLIYLFLGGFLLAAAMQRCNLHRRVALNVVRLVGSRPDQLVGGFMLATALLSMWVSNTATAAMMLPIGLSVIRLVDSDHDASPGKPDNFAITLLLGIAFSATIGGVATLIGTPPNAFMAGFLLREFGIQISISRWLVIGLPMSLFMLALAWITLTRFIFPVGHEDRPEIESVIKDELSRMGSMSRAEKIVAVIFVCTASAWVLRPLLQNLLPDGTMLSDSGIAILAAVLMFAIPVDWKKRRFLLDWEAAQELPWGVLVLFGGGLSLGTMIGDSGLSAAIADCLAGIGDLPIVAIALIVAAVVAGVSHLTSNTATAAAFLPLVASLAIRLNVDPLLLVIPATFAASFVFMLPVATPPNTIVFGARILTVPQMAKAGLLLNLVALLLIALLVPLLPLIGFDMASLITVAP